jgi:hypothetical protein
MAASRRAMPASALTGNHSSGSRSSSAHREYVTTWVHKERPVKGPDTGRVVWSCEITAVSRRLAASFEVTGSEGTGGDIAFSFIGLSLQAGG